MSYVHSHVSLQSPLEVQDPGMPQEAPLLARNQHSVDFSQAGETDAREGRGRAKLGSAARAGDYRPSPPLCS
jgi:hypothetical protein